MARAADIVVLVVTCSLTAGFYGYQYGYDSKLCKPEIKREVPLAERTHKQQVRAVKLMMKDKGAMR